MKQYEDKAPAEMTFNEVSVATHALTLVAERLMQRNARPELIEDFVDVAKKLNDILKSNEFNHYTDEKFKKFEKYIKEHSEV